jgi:hypothetical protein
MVQFDHSDKQRLEQLVQQTRWNEVTDARKRILERLEVIDEAQFSRRTGLTQDRIAIMQQRSVQRYVQQVETILDPVAGRTTEWWTDKWIGAFELPNGDMIEVIGLEQYVDLDEEISYQVSETYKPHAAHVGTTRTVERTTTPPVGLHRNAFRATNRALADQGIEFDPRDKDVGEGDVGAQTAVSPS